MNLDSYKILISSLPVRQQSFTTKRETWDEAEKEITWLKQLNENLFNGHPDLTISRQDIFETVDLRETIIKTIYWGYSSGMRGNHFVNILGKIGELEYALTMIKEIDKPAAKHFDNLIKELKSIEGLGLSTCSKFLYFLQITFNGNPCLILDRRLINVFARETYPEYQQLGGIRYGDNAEKKYLDYLQLTSEVSKKLETKGENIEQFLYLFGNNLKRPV